MRASLRFLGVWLGAPLLLATVLYLAIWARYRIAAPPALPATQRAAIVEVLRAAVEGRAPTGKVASRPLVGPLWVTLYRRGEVLLRIKREDKDLSAAVAAGAAELRKSTTLAKLAATERSALRIKLDLLVAEGAIVSSIPLFFAKGLVPGLDGLGLEIDGKRRAYLLPDDLYKRELMAGYQPFFFMHEFKTGLDLKAAVNTFANELALTVEAWRKAKKRYFRFRVESFVEGPAGAERGVHPVVRQRVPVSQITRATVKQALERSADYVLRQLQKNGRFHYIYYPLSDRHHMGDDYSLPRHAGTTWFLSLAFKTLRKPRLRVAAEQAIRYLAAHAVPPSCQNRPFACVGKEGYADLGSAGLALVAIVEYTEATKDQRYLPLARKLGQFILNMQKENGDFCHQYEPRKNKKNCKDILLYYAGEATLGLARLQRLTGDERYLRPMERALDFLVDGKYRFFMGKFFISEDHWTCIAAEAAYPAVKKEAYLEFCRAFGRLNHRAQVQRGEALSDLWGGFAITPFFMPHNTPVGSRSEANVGTYLLSQHWGRPDPLVRETILAAMRYLVDQQLRAESAYLLPNPKAASGGLTQTPIRAQIRIDYVQHAAAAMARALPIIPEEPWPATR